MRLSLLAAVALLSLALGRVFDSVREGRQRRRESFSRAFAATVEYSEFPYVIRRRRASDPEGERIRISEELKEIQSQIAYYEAWLGSESRRVANAFSELVERTRAIAGQAMHQAWESPPVSNDDEMNIQTSASES